MKRLLLSLTGLVLVSACASSGALKIGNDTYMSTSRVPFSGESGAREQILTVAGNYCRGIGKEIKVTEVTSHECGLRGGCAEAQATYMCLSKDDPRYQQQ